MSTKPLAALFWRMLRLTTDCGGKNGLFVRFRNRSGTAGPPATIAASVLALFEIVDRAESKAAKAVVAQQLRSFDIKTAAILPTGTKELFQRVFGKTHFSLKCFFRSACFSIGAIILIGLLTFVFSPELFIEFNSEVLFFVGWAIWSIFFDYLSLYKSRIILIILSDKVENNLVFFIILLIFDFLVSIFLFIIFFQAVIQTVTVIFANILLGNPLPSAREFLRVTFNFCQYTGLFSFRNIIDTLSFSYYIPSICFYAGMLPSIWLWTYVFVLLLTRTMLHSQRLVDFLRWFLDLDEHPFRSLGTIAAVCTFMVSAAAVGLAKLV
jgi:hypothetical protein